MTGRLLILSYSPIASDARVLKQVRLFSDLYEVTTCGYGPAPEGVSDHVQIPDELLSWRVDKKLVLTRRFTQAWRTQEVTAWVRPQLASRTFDAILADDVETVPLALELAPRGGVHADLHEYATRQKEELLRWKLFVAPYIRHLVTRYVAQAASVTTVARGLAEQYSQEFSLTPGVVMNAAPYQNRDVQPTQDTLRLVHTGAGLENRHLEIMIEAMDGLSRPATLDLYLTPNDPECIVTLRALAADVNTRAGVERVRVNDPVPYDQLADTLAGFDVGVFVLPPVNFNYKHALPNKLFDFIQARLAIVVSPSPEMAHLVRSRSLGAVTAGFTAKDLRATLESLSQADVDRAKRASHEAAAELSAEKQSQAWADAIAALMARVPKDIRE